MEGPTPVTERPPSLETIAWQYGYRPPREITSMTFASISGDLTKVQEGLSSYLQRQQDPKLYEFESVLNEAIRYKQAEIVSYLLSAGVPLEKIHCYRATEAKSPAVYEAFLQNGWDINTPLDTYEPPALGFIVDHWELTCWFLDHGANPNAACFFDYTPMSLAVKHAPLRTIKLLFDHGGDIRKGQLIHHAVERGSEDVIEMLDLLLEKGAQLDERKYENHWPSWNMRFFMGLGTPLHGATRVGNLQVVKYLLQKGANSKSKDSKGHTALYHALKEGLSEIATCLEINESGIEKENEEEK